MKDNILLMDTGGRRLKRRKKWLLFSLLPMIMVFGAALKFITPGVSTHFLKLTYESGDYETAKFWGQMNLFVNVFEPYIAYFNNGTVSFARDEFGVAEEQFGMALLYDPPEERRCDVRVNLSLSIEAQADALVKQKKYDEAIVMYDRAKAALYGDSCADPVDDTGKSAEARESRKRIDEKQEETVRMRNNDQPAENDDDSDEQDESEQPASQSQKQDLKDQMDAARRHRQNGEGARRGDSSQDGSGYEPGRKIW